MARLINKIKIEIDGNELNNFMQISLQQSTYGFHILEIVYRREEVYEKTAEVIMDKATKLLGERISFSLKTDSDDKLEFEGIVTAIHANKMDDTETDTVIIEASGTDILLEDGEHCRSFEDKTLKSIVEKILNEYQLSAKNVKPEHCKETLPYTVQCKESSYAFLSRLAAKKGEWFYYDGKNIVFGKRNAKTVKLNFREDLFDFEVSLKLNDVKFKYLGYDYLTNEIYEASSDKEHIKNITKQIEAAIKKSDAKLKHETLVFYNHPLTQDKEKEHLQDRVKLMKNAIVADLFTCSGSTDNANLKVGGEIKILDYFDKDGKKRKAPVDHGTYIITNLSHSCDSTGNYQNHFMAVPADIEVPPFSSPHNIPFCETQSAKVIDVDDPEKLGRIKVQFVWQKPENFVSPWLRIVTPYSGKDQGFLFLPEVDDEVLVAFEGGNAEKPYVIGTLYHGKAKPDNKWLNADNDIKAIRTRGGHTIEFGDKDGNEELKIYDHKNDKYEITLSAHSSTVTIKSKGDLNLKGEGDVKIEAGGNLNLKAGNNMEINAGNNLKTSAMSATTEATTNMELKAAAGMKIDGGAQLEQKAVIIRIN